MLQGKAQPKDAEWLNREIEALAAVGAAARLGRLRACISSEINFERRKGGVGARWSRTDLWNSVNFEHVDPAVERSRWMGSLSIGEVLSAEHKQEFVNRLLHFARHGVPQVFFEYSDVPDFERRNLAKLNELASLCTAVGETRWVDAFHFWTALCDDVDFFLTTDKKFLEALREKDLSADWVCRAVSPSTLMEILNLPPRSLPITGGELVYLFSN